MPKTALQMTTNEWKRYKPLSKAGQKPDLGTAAPASHENALKVARQAARLLKDHFGAKRVVVFGSLATNVGFTKFSDIDLGEWGIPDDQYYLAVAAVTGLSAQYKIDLIDVESCRGTIKETILEQGVEL